MTASVRALAVLAAIAALLGVLVIREARRPAPAAVDRALLPGFDAEKVTALSWDRSPLPAVTVKLGDPPQWTSGTTVARADAARVRDVLAAVRSARWHRREDAAAAGQVTVQLSLVAGATTRVIGVGQELAGAEQQWLVVGDRALLVDRWVARALAPDPLALRSLRPFADAAQAKTLTIAPDVRLERDPWRMGSPQPLLVRAELGDAFVHALEAVEIVRLSRAPAGVDPAAISVTAGIAGTLRAACPDDAALAYVTSAAGDGCISRAAFEAVRAAAAALHGEPEAVAEPRLVPGTVTQVELRDGARLDLTRAPSIAGAPADPARVAELLAVLAAPQEVLRESSQNIEIARLHVDAGATRITLVLLGGSLVQRDGENVQLHLSRPAWEVLARGAAAYAERSLWAEEPTTVTTLQIDDVTYKRGAVVGEWTREPAGPVDGAKVEALVAALSSVDRGGSLGAGPFAAAHVVVLTLASFTGAAGTHTLGVGRKDATGCIADAGRGVAAHLPAATCAAIDALAN